MITINVSHIPYWCKDFETGVTCRYLDESLVQSVFEKEGTRACKLYNALSTIKYTEYEINKAPNNKFIWCSECLKNQRDGLLIYADSIIDTNT